MNCRGYKWFDEAKTRRSAEVLQMEKGESLAAFKKRCDLGGFDVVDGRNLVDHYQFLSEELINGDLDKKRNPNLFLLCVNIINDFNVASICRSSNAFGVQEVIIFGDKDFDRRGCTGVQNYTNFNHVRNLNEFYDFSQDFKNVISLENCSGSQPIEDYQWDYDNKTLIVVGQESIGVPQEFLDISRAILEISMKGSVRSINVAQAASIALYDYNAKMPR